MDDAIHFGPVSVTALPAAIGLLNASLGEAYVEAEDVRAHVAGEVSFILGATVNSELVGLIMARALDRGEVTHLVERVTTVSGEALPAMHHIGMIKSIVVKPGWRGRRIGSALMQAAIDQLRQRGCIGVVSASWESGEATSAGLFARLGFHELARIEEFWRDDSERRGYDCPKCGRPCRCAALIYFKEF